MQQPVQSQTLLKIPQAANLLQAHRSTIYGWVADGILPAVRIGRSLRIRKEDLERTLSLGSTKREVIA